MASGHVAVVGAGLSGLSASLELKRLGYTVDLFERRRLLGGKATSFEIDGFEVDNGQHVYLGCCTEFVKFVDVLGVSTPGRQNEPPASPLFIQDRFEALLLCRDQKTVRLRSANLPAPLHLLPALLAYRSLGIFGRLQVGLALLTAKSPAPPGETFDAWLSRHGQGRASRSAFWEPFLVPALNAPFDQVDAESALFVIRTAFLQDAGAARFGWSRVPLGRLAEAAATKVDNTYRRTAVVGLKMIGPSNSGHNRVSLVLSPGKTTDPYDGVVLAVPPKKLKSIMARPKELGVFGLDSFHDAAIVDVHLWYDREPIGFGFASLLGSPVQWVFEKSAPAGEAYFSCSMSAAAEFSRLRNEDLVNLCDSELKAVLPDLRAFKPIRSRTTRDPEATFVPSVGLRRPGPRTKHKRLVLAGAWTNTGWPATMESAVRSGNAAAIALHSNHAT
jgi:hydroxysqualene dehydroxylase